MSVFTPAGGSTGGAGTTGVAGVVTPLIQNVPLPTAGTEVTHVLPANTKRFAIQLRPGSKATLKLAYTLGQSGTIYFTIPPNVFHSEEGISAASTTLYIQATLAAQVAEITSWI